MNENGLPESICTCPFSIDCKHGVAVVLEYLDRVENNRPVTKAGKNDERLALIDDEDLDDESDENDPASTTAVTTEIDTFLKGKTKSQLIELILDLAEKYPDMAQDLADRRQILSGNVKYLVTRLGREIREIGEEPGRQNYWQGEGYTPDYSGIRTKLETLLKAGHADSVLALGKELIEVGTRHVEESHDEGETAMEVAGCMPVVVKAMEQSSMETEEKLVWAVDVVLKDPFEICEAFAGYLHRKHPKAAWGALADRLLERLKRLKSNKDANDFIRNYDRDRLSDWAIHALDLAGRKDEIIPLCEAEAKKTGSYDRLVKRLVSARRHEEAERWIQEGIRSTREKLPGIASSLRNKLLEIRTRQKDWPVVAAMQAEEFVRHPSRKTFMDCRKASEKVKAWPKVSGYLLAYLESGRLPWKQEEWPLPESGLDAPVLDRRERFPIVENLIEIAILEKEPDQVLHWYDRISKKRYGWYGVGVNEDEIAEAVKDHAPERAVAIWKNKAERLIAQVKPSAYQEAAKFLRKAGKIMTREKKQADWGRYLEKLREEHARKLRLMEVLDGLEGRPIIKRR